MCLTVHGNMAQEFQRGNEDEGCVHLKSGGISGSQDMTKQGDTLK